MAKTITQQAAKPAAKPAAPAKTVAKPATKTAPAKTAPKPAAPVKSKAPAFYAALLAEALAGKFGQNIQRFYVNAISYHRKQKTAFPRARIADVPLMDQKQSREFLEKHAGTSIPPGSHAGQRLFDQMMVEAQQAAQQAAK